MRWENEDVEGMEAVRENVTGSSCTASFCVDRPAAAKKRRWRAKQSDSPQNRLVSAFGRGQEGDTASGEGSIELWNDSLRPEDAGKVLSVGGVQYGPEVWLGETLLYRYKDNAFPFI